MQCQGIESLFGGSAGYCDPIVSPLAGLAHNLLLGQHRGPLSSPHIDRCEVEAVGIDDVAGRIPDSEPLAVRRVLRDE